MARVEALHTMCIGNKVCVELVPEVFQLDKYGCVDIPDSEFTMPAAPKPPATTPAAGADKPTPAA